MGLNTELLLELRGWVHAITKNDQACECLHLHKPNQTRADMKTITHALVGIVKKRYEQKATIS